ncbi:MAG: histidine phosphatase family protein [Caldilineaceae bacterium]
MQRYCLPATPHRIGAGPRSVTTSRQDHRLRSRARLKRKTRGIFTGPRRKKIYASPLERTHRTAQLAAAVVGLPVVTEELIAEWRRGEQESEVLTRINDFWERICWESERLGPVTLVTHGGPIKVMLLNLGYPKAAVDEYCRKFDRGNPVPPAGVWLATRDTIETPWHLELVFTPSGELPTVPSAPWIIPTHSHQAETTYV